MAVVAEHARNEHRRAATHIFHVDVVIELNGQQVHVGETFDQRLVPASKVSDVRQRRGVAEEVVPAFDAKAEGWPAVVADRQRLTVQTGRDLERAVRVERT